MTSHRSARGLWRAGAGVVVALVAGPSAANAALPRSPIPIDGAQIELVVGLSAPSLSEYARSQPSLGGFATHGRRVSVNAFGSRLYLDQLARQQAQVAARIERAIPSARVRWHYSFVLNGLAVTLPARQAPRLGAVPGVARVYPDLEYHAMTDTVPGLVGATPLWGAPPVLPTAGQGIKIGIVDDGIDQSNPFFNPAGFAPPPGFPRGDLRYTTGKVIVARSFPPSGGDAGSKLPFDPKISEHATHVSGIAAGDYGTLATPGGALPQVANLSGVAPRAYLGNYRALTISDPLHGAVGGTAEIAAAVDRAAADGMDVINMSLGGIETDPRSDALVKAVEDAVSAGIVVTISAGNSFEELGAGSIGSPGSATDAITVAATTTSRYFGVRAAVLGPGAVPAPLQSFTAAASSTPRIPPSFAAPQNLVDSRVAVPGNDGLCGPIEGRPLAGKLVLVDRGNCLFVIMAARAKAAGAVGIVLRNNLLGDPEIIEERLSVPVAFVTQSVGDGLRSFLAGSGGQAQVVIQSAVAEVPTAPKVVADFSSSGPTPFTRQLKPDISAPGVAILSSVPNAAKSYPGPFAVFSGTSMAAPAVAGAAALLLQLHPTWTPQDVKSALMSTATPGFADSSQAGEASVLREGAGFLNVQAASDPGIVLAPSSLGFGLVDGGRGGTFSPTVAVRDIIGGGHWDITTALQPGAPAGVTVTAPPSVDLPANGTVGFPVSLTVPAGSAAGDVTGFVTLTNGPRVRRIPFWALVERPALATATVHQLRKPGIYEGNTHHGSNAVTTYRYPANLAGTGLPAHFTGPEQLWRFHLSKRVYNAGVTIESDGKVDARPLLLAQRDENTVTGEAGLPLDVGPNPFTSGLPEPAAGMWFVQPGDYYVAVDSPRAKDAGAYKLHFWVNDLTPPKLKLLTPTVAFGDSAALHFSISDAQSGVDPFSVLAIGNSLVPLPYDPRTETASLRISGLRPGTYRVAVLASDYAQSKDVIGVRLTTANTVFKIFKFKVLKTK